MIKVCIDKIIQVWFKYKIIEVWFKYEIYKKNILSKILYNVLWCYLLLFACYLIIRVWKIYNLPFTDMEKFFYNSCIKQKWKGKAIVIQIFLAITIFLCKLMFKINRFGLQSEVIKNSFPTNIFYLFTALEG